MPDTHYLSIGEVLGLLLEDFPDVTISKIRFLESQGLIEPERTPSGYRKFYDHDVDLLRTILHEQRENFLPLKVIRDRIESGGIHTDATGGRTPPRGIRNVDVRPPVAGPLASAASATVEHRDSVFRRTDGGPEWADGRALIPGGTSAGRAASTTPITTSIPVTPHAPERPAAAEPTEARPGDADPATSAAVADQPSAARPEAARPSPTRAEAAPGSTGDGAPVVAPTAAAAPIEPVRPAAPPAAVVEAAAKGVRASPAETPAPAPRQPDTDSAMPYNREELCVAAQISSEQLDALESYGLISARGVGRDAAYPQEVLEIAIVAGRFLAHGIDARHLRSWRQSADRESTLFEQRIMPLLRQRNPASRQLALDTLAELAELGGRLHKALIDSTLRHHFEGT